MVSHCPFPPEADSPLAKEAKSSKWFLIYREAAASRSEAIKKERLFKSGVGRKLLKSKLLFE